MNAARQKAWETRRAKYGDRGHCGYAPRPTNDGALRLVIQMLREGILSEGQVAQATGLDRVDIRRLADSRPDTQPVMSEANAPIPAVQSGAVATELTEFQRIVSEQDLAEPYWQGYRDALNLVASQGLAAPQSEPLPGGVGEADVRLLMKARSAIEAGLATLNGLGAKVGGRVSLMATTSAEITARLATDSGSRRDG